MAYAKSNYAALGEVPLKAICREIARKLVEDELERHGVIVDRVDPAEIAKTAEELLADKETANSIFKEAKVELRRRHREGRP